MSCFTVRAVKACSFIIYLCKSQRYGTVFFIPVGYQCSRSNISDELCSQLSKTACFQFYLGKCFQSPFFSIRFCLCEKTAVCWHTNSYSMVFNQRAQLNFNGKQFFFPKVQKLVHEHINTRY